MDVTLRGNMSQIQSVGLIRFGLQAAYLLLLLDKSKCIEELRLAILMY